MGGWGGLKRAQEKGSVGEKRTGLFSRLVTDPFLTVESNKQTLINMIPKVDSVEKSSFITRRV